MKRRKHHQVKLATLINSSALQPEPGNSTGKMKRPGEAWSHVGEAGERTDSTQKNMLQWRNMVCVDTKDRGCSSAFQHQGAAFVLPNLPGSVFFSLWSLYLL